MDKYFDLEYNNGDPFLNEVVALLDRAQDLHGVTIDRHKRFISVVDKGEYLDAETSTIVKTTEPHGSYVLQYLVSSHIMGSSIVLNTFFTRNDRIDQIYKAIRKGLDHVMGQLEVQNSEVFKAYQNLNKTKPR